MTSCSAGISFLQPCTLGFIWSKTCSSIFGQTMPYQMFPPSFLTVSWILVKPLQPLFVQYSRNLIHNHFHISVCCKVCSLYDGLNIFIFRQTLFVFGFPYRLQTRRLKCYITYIAASVFRNVMLAIVELVVPSIWVYVNHANAMDIHQNVTGRQDCVRWVVCWSVQVYLSIYVLHSQSWEMYFLFFSNDIV